MTVYEFLLHAARSYSGVANGGKTEEIRIDLTRKSIWSGRLPIMREGKLLLKSVRLENGEVCKLEGLIDFEGDAYAEIEAMMTLPSVPEYTCCCLLADKEEIGSVGATGMRAPCRG